MKDLLAQAAAIIKQFDERQDVALPTRIMAHGNEALGLLRHMLERPEVSLTFKVDTSSAVEAVMEAGSQALNDLAKTIHYPECWDTVAYPTLETACKEIEGSFQCQENHPEDIVRRTLDLIEDAKKAGMVKETQAALSDNTPTLGEAWEKYQGGKKLSYAEAFTFAAGYRAALPLKSTPEAIVRRTLDLIEDAKKVDMLVSIELRSPEPYAMGVLEMAADFRARRHSDRITYDANDKADYTYQYNPDTVASIKRGLDAKV